MKLVTIAPRSGFPIQDGSKYLLSSISFNRLRLAVCLISPTIWIKQIHKVHEITRSKIKRAQKANWDPHYGLPI